MTPAPSLSPSSRTERGVRLCREGLVVGGRAVPLLAASVHYWRLEPSSWRACLEAVKRLGYYLVDTYVPWAEHERAPGRYDFGEGDPRLDVKRFLRLAHELGLFAIVRPGPHINAELTTFGIPERIIWDSACQARSAAGNPVPLPMLPTAFPVPSYASQAFHDEAARWLRASAAELAPLRYPDGPVVMVQVDNEGSLYFRDGAYDQDYHPDAVALYRAWVRDRVRTLEGLEARYGAAIKKEGADAALSFATLEPPTRFDAPTPEALAWHLDWSEFHEHLIETAMGRFAAALHEGGLGGLPLTHNLPPGEDATALNAARLHRHVDLVGIDLYQTATPTNLRIVARRTSELAVRCEALSVPAFSNELGAGFPPFFPPIDERDSEFTTLAALAFGLRGYNTYMAVERERWIGAPIDPRGRERPFARFFQRLHRAFELTRFGSLRREVPVRIVLPRSARRLARSMHAFGPLPAIFFSALGAGARERCLEHELGLGAPVALESERFVEAFEHALLARGVPFAHVGGEDRATSLDGAAWAVCASPGALNPALFERLAEVAAAGTAVTLGPHAPRFDGAFQPLGSPLDVERLRGPRTGDVPLVTGADARSADEAVARAIDALGLPTYAVDPSSVELAVHRDDAGEPRVLFVLHAESTDTQARFVIPGFAGRAVDLLGEGHVTSDADGVFELVARARTARMFALERASS